MELIQKHIEKYAFGVCTRIGEKFEMPTTYVRLFFIYSSFLTFGSPIIVYLLLAFIMKFRRILRRRHNTLWYY